MSKNNFIYFLFKYQLTAIMGIPNITSAHFLAENWRGYGKGFFIPTFNIRTGI